MKVGYIGYGLLGKIIFDRFYKLNQQIKIYNRSKKKISHLKKKNRVDKVHNIINDNKIIFIILYDDKSIIELFNTIGKKLNNKVIVNLTTISYKTSLYLSEKSKDRGCIWIDAPILGSIEAAKKNKLVFLYSGQKNKLVTRYLNSIGKIIYYNQNSSSQFIKLCHNSICSMIMIAIGEVFFLSKKYKINKKLIYEMIESSAFFSPLIESKIKKYKKDNFKPSFTLFNMLKDLKYVKQLSNKDKFLINQTYFKFKSKYKNSYKNKDTSFISKLIENEKI